MIIRQYAAKDIPALIKMRFDFSGETNAIEPDLYDQFHQECSDFFNEIQENGRWKIWVAEENGSIVSHVFVEIVDTVPRPGRKKSPWGYVTNVYTVPSHRSKGIGGELMEGIRCWARENGLTFLLVWPSETSVDFYGRHGFERALDVMENHVREKI